MYVSQNIYTYLKVPCRKCLKLILHFIINYISLHTGEIKVIVFIISFIPSAQVLSLFLMYNYNSDILFSFKHLSLFIV